MPAFYQILGYLGLLPFIMLAVGLLILPSGAVSSVLGFAQAAYAAVILSFLAGIHWPFAVEKGNKMQMGLAMAPPLIACALIVFVFISGALVFALLVYAICFAALYAMDRFYERSGQWPGGYMIFRLRLTAGVCACLILSASGLML